MINWKQILVCSFLCLFASSALADNYRITSADADTDSAIKLFAENTEKLNVDIELDHVPRLGASDQLVPILNAGMVDIVVINLEAYQPLAGSALLTPWLAEDSLVMRDIIKSEIGAFEKHKAILDGYRVLDFWHIGSTIFASNTQVASVEQLLGQKIAESGQIAANTLEALGGSPIGIPIAEVHNAINFGSVESAAIPIGSDFRSIDMIDMQAYVDRIYGQRLYAVLVSNERWDNMPFADQHYLAKVAEEVGDLLAETRLAEKDEFVRTRLSNGATFYRWSQSDVQSIRDASLDVRKNLGIDDGFLNAAFELSTDNKNAPVGQVASNLDVQQSIYFVTDRRMADLENPVTAFSSSVNIEGHSFGEATLLLKKGRRYGDSLADVVTIENLDILSRDGFFGSIASDPIDKELVVYIHGYNNSFADSVRRGAAIKSDIAGNANVISYTWPSDGEVLGYGYDLSSTDTAHQTFRLFMDKLTECVDSARINFVAHSMGSRLLTFYLSRLADRSITPRELKFKNIVFAAPDISTQFFKQKEELPVVKELPISSYSDSMTVYSSKHDRALGFSKTVNGNARLGLASGKTIYLASNIISIDASNIDPAKWYQKFSTATRHSYVFDKAAGVRDLSLALKGQLPQQRPKMVKKLRDEHVYWVLGK